MKKFLKITVLTLLFLIVLAFVLDAFYTYSYKNPVNPRNKVSWFKTLSKENNYNYAFFGSSRCLNTVDPKLIDETKRLEGVNLAYNGSNPFEIKLMVHQFLDRYNPDKIFVQVDDRFDRERNDPTATIFWLPFIEDEYIYEKIKERDELAWEYKHIPFYRYTLYESKIGIRDVFFSYIKGTEYAKSNYKGFHPVNGVTKEDKINNKVLPDQSNIHLKEIVEICKRKDVEVFFFTSPYFKFNLNTEVIAKHLDNYSDYSTFLTERKYFHDPSHLNKQGAKLFTEKLIQDYFNQ